MNLQLSLSARICSIQILVVVLLCSSCGFESQFEARLSENQRIAREEGLKEGWEMGYSTGYSQGHHEGLSSGYNAGFLKGEETGYNGGYQDGTQAGYKKGKEEGLAFNTLLSKWMSLCFFCFSLLGLVGTAIAVLWLRFSRRQRELFL